MHARRFIYFFISIYPSSVTLSFPAFLQLVPSLLRWLCRPILPCNDFHLSLLPPLHHSALVSLTFVVLFALISFLQPPLPSFSPPALVSLTHFLLVLSLFPAVSLSLFPSLNFPTKTVLPMALHKTQGCLLTLSCGAVWASFRPFSLEIPPGFPFCLPSTLYVSPTSLSPPSPPPPACVVFTHHRRRE